MDGEKTNGLVRINMVLEILVLVWKPSSPALGFLSLKAQQTRALAAWEHCLNTARVSLLNPPVYPLPSLHLLSRTAVPVALKVSRRKLISDASAKGRRKSMFQWLERRKFFQVAGLQQKHKVFGKYNETISLRFLSFFFFFFFQPEVILWFLTPPWDMHRHILMRYGAIGR